MAKDLTNKMIADMAKVQIESMKRNHPELIVSSYERLKEYLAEGLKEYSQEIVSVNRKVDMGLLKSLQDGNKTTAGKLISAAMINNFDGNNSGEVIRDKHLVTLYKNDERARRYIVNYGPKTRKLLSDYLTKRGLIE